MTLSVDAFTWHQNGDIVWLPIRSDLAGFDSARHSFYGGDQALKAGLVLLPTLRDSAPLIVNGDDLKPLKQEVHILKSLLEPDEQEFWEFRLENILEAIEAAEKHGELGGVSIG